MHGVFLVVLGQKIGFISKLKVNPNGLWTEIRVGVLSSSYEGRKIQE